MRWFAVLGVLALVLSGCASSKDSSSSTTLAPSTSKAANTTAPAPNHAPVIGAFAANVTKGAAPLKVRFTFNATDADKDNLTYVLSLGDGSANKTGALKAGNQTVVLANYTAAGNLTARLVVKDPKGAMANRTLALTITLPVVAGPHQCDIVPDQTVGDLYYTTEGGGNWIFQEANGIPGLQVENNSLTGPASGTIGESNKDWADCVNGDQLIF
jgi:hypothetical protein